MIPTPVRRIVTPTNNDLATANSLMAWAEPHLTWAIGVQPCDRFIDDYYGAKLIYRISDRHPTPRSIYFVVRAQGFDKSQTAAVFVDAVYASWNSTTHIGTTGLSSNQPFTLGSLWHRDEARHPENWFIQAQDGWAVLGLTDSVYPSYNCGSFIRTLSAWNDPKTYAAVPGIVGCRIQPTNGELLDGALRVNGLTPYLPFNDLNFTFGNGGAFRPNYHGIDPGLLIDGPEDRFSIMATHFPLFDIMGKFAMSWVDWVGTTRITNVGTVYPPVIDNFGARWTLCRGPINSVGFWLRIQDEVAV